MGTVRDLTRRLAADHRITADEAKRLVDAVKADGNVSAEEKAELNQALARFQDAFDAPAWKLMQDNARGLGVAVSDRSPVSLNNRPELADIAAGRKALSSTSNRKDPAVATVQRALMTLARLDNRPELGLAGAGADGDYGAETANAVKAFQAYAGLKADGVLGKQTLAKLAEAVARVTRPQPQPETTPAEPLKNARFKGEPVLEKVAKGELTLANGARGEAVKRLQTALMDLGYTLPQFGADGGFGGESRRALEQFQKDRGLAVSGRLDAATLRKLDEVSPAPGANAVLYPEYDQMFKDGVLDVTLGLGYDEVGSDLAERRKLLTGLRSRGFESLDVARLTDAQLRERGLDPAKIDRQGTYFFKKITFNGKPASVLIKYVDRDTAGHKDRFASGFAQSDLVLYGGHARYGSGPDFDHKESTAGNFVIGANAAGHRNGTLTQSYDAHMREILKDSPNDLERAQLTNDYQLMFFSGCTTKHYLDEMRGIPRNKDQKNLDFIGSDEVLYWNHIANNVLTVLDSVMVGESQNDISRRLFEINTVTFTADGFGGNRYRP